MPPRAPLDVIHGALVRAQQAGVIQLSSRKPAAQQACQRRREAGQHTRHDRARTGAPRCERGGHSRGAAQRQARTRARARRPTPPYLERTSEGRRAKRATLRPKLDAATPGSNEYVNVTDGGDDASDAAVAPAPTRQPIWAHATLRSPLSQLASCR